MKAYLITTVSVFLWECRRATFQNTCNLLCDKVWEKCILYVVLGAKTLFKQSLSGRHWSTYIRCINLSATYLSFLIYTASVIYKQHFYGLYMTKDKINYVGSRTSDQIWRPGVGGWIYQSLTVCCLKSGSHFPKKLFYLFQWKPFKNDEKCFLIPLEIFFSFSRYLNFSFDFLAMFKNGLIRKIRLISRFMMSQPG